MKKFISTMVVLTLLLAAGDAMGQGYLCDKVPMYPVGGGQWMHYALRYDASCGTPSPTGHIDVYAPSAEMCPGGCTSLTDGVTVSNPDVYLKDPPLPPADLNSATECRDYLVYQAPSLPGSKYSSFNYIWRGHVELTRPDGSKFYAVVFRMAGGGHNSGIGFEIAGTVTPNLTNYEQWNAVHEQPGESPEAINGLLKVRLHHNPNNNDVAYIRISASDENLTADFPLEPAPAPTSIAPESAVPPSDGYSVSPSTSQCTQWCYRPQRWHCRPRRWRCR